MARFRTTRVLIVLLLVLIAAACDGTPPPVGMARGEELFETCEPCHGAAATGNPNVAAPAIAGLPQWYVEEQLNSFQSGYRGKHAQDLPGLRMRPMAVILKRRGDVTSVAEYVASLDRVLPPSTLRGDAGAGAALFVVCVVCHGENGEGNRDLHSPPIFQLDDWYLLAQLQNFKSGARGAHSGDVWGTTMRVNTLSMSDQEMRDVIAYVQTLR